MAQDAHAKVTIVNRLGLHARPAMALVDLASSFPCKVNVGRADTPDECVDAKSIMQVMMLAATKDVELEFFATGDRADEAVGALAQLVQSGFDED